jgi:hypothetical protein
MPDLAILNQILTLVQNLLASLGGSGLGGL